MPGFDGTGPNGMGSMTGRGRGFCAVPLSQLNQARIGRGFGRGRNYFGGRGGGRGWRHWYYNTGIPGWARGGYAAPAFYNRVNAGYDMPYGYYPYYPEYIDPKEEAEMLKEQSKALQDEINALNERIEELEKSSQSENKK
ncbi:MAG: hypothetical protein BWY26_01666 [Elusimicrobia bacterium ADurb.Bin231]|nr:MAG: hypothetical protein BWY26_01666 [Elusimicrobia bacterium ADurb.Bin231]